MYSVGNKEFCPKNGYTMRLAADSVYKRYKTVMSELYNQISNDNYRCHGNSATCYQLVQSVLKMDSALAERMAQGKVGG